MSERHTEYAWLRINDKLMFGTFQDTSKGICIMGVSPKERRKIITPNFQRAINNMNLLDVVCRENDHTPNNYYPVIDKNLKAVDVSVFDKGMFMKDIRTAM